MKNTVDLTANNLFSGSPILSIKALMQNNRDLTIPWRYRRHHKQLGAVLTGDSSERKIGETVRLDVIATNGEEIPYCYRCGKRLVSWRRCGGLCKECYRDLQQYEKDNNLLSSYVIPWRHASQSVFKTEDRVVFEMNYTNSNTGLGALI